MSNNKKISILIAALLILGLAIIFRRRLENPKINEISSPAAITKKVMVLNFDPHLSAAKNWNNPKNLAGQYAADVNNVSHNYVNYDINNWQDIDDFPRLNDGFKYTEQSYFGCLNNNNNCHKPWEADYKKILEDYGVCNQVNQGAVDELWLFGGPWFGYFEANMAGAGAFWTNGPVVTGTACNRPIHIMGFNYERGNSEMIEDLGHRVEGTMTKLFGTWQPGRQDNDWNKFTGYEKISGSDNSACGTVHFAPNSVADYDWANRRSVSSKCSGWLNYPHFSDTAETINCSAWNCSGYDYKKWWLNHLPHAPGTSGGKQNNWWKYVVDFANAGAMPDPTVILPIQNVAASNKPSPLVSASPSVSPNPSSSINTLPVQPDTGTPAWITLALLGIIPVLLILPRR